MVTFLRGLAGGVPMGECELWRTWLLSNDSGARLDIEVRTERAHRVGVRRVSREAHDLTDLYMMIMPLDLGVPTSQSVNRCTLRWLFCFVSNRSQKSSFAI